MLYGDCYNDDAEHTFASFSDDGKIKNIIKALIMNLEMSLFLFLLYITKQSMHSPSLKTDIRIVMCILLTFR